METQNEYKLLAHTVDGMAIVEMRIGKYITLVEGELKRPQKTSYTQKTSYGTRVVLARKEMRMTQQRLADNIGISRNYLSQIEKGKAVNISANIARAIEGKCGVRL